ncbi:MAG TPA: ADP-ribosylglycohydrolase family protein [Jatrophihabitantaceae bacterium]
MSGLADRAAGCLVGQAYGDALGVPYEYGSRPLDDVPALLGGGLGDYEPGEWSDDTQMTVCVALAALDADLGTEAGLDAVAERFEDWYAGRPADVGVQTATVLRDAELLTGSPATRLRAAARALHERSGRTAGNGALMRAAPVALARHGDASAIAAAARAVAELTHTDPLAGDSCVLWCLAIDAALRGDSPDPADHVNVLPAERRDQWAAWIDAADGAPPSTFADNGFTVTALQAAWAGIRAGSDFLGAVNAAIHARGDTDTVAAIAGSLAGAAFGLAAFHDERVARVHGWPGLNADDLAEIGRRLVS